MPYFSVMMQGQGIKIISADGSDPIVGFFTTRMVQASSSVEAERKAKEMVTGEWTSGIYAKANKGTLPNVIIESVSQTTLPKYLKFKNKGYSFYCRED